MGTLMGPFPLVVLLLVGGPDAVPPDDQPMNAPASQQASTSDPAAPITGIGRLNWAVHSTIGPASLWTGVLSSTWGTVFDKPRPYGESFDGWAKRYGLRLTGVATSNVAEAELGFIWGEDPRYHRGEGTFGGRFHRTLKMTFLSEKQDGTLMPAYARYIAIAGTNVLSDAWRPNGDRSPENTLLRIGEGFGGRLLGNMWEEFWPDMKKHMFFAKH
jgi:hypothetical protein